jgi:hypothetical protein
VLGLSAITCSAHDLEHHAFNPDKQGEQAKDVAAGPARRDTAKGPNADATNKPQKWVFVLAGQSNMVGPTTAGLISPGGGWAYADTVREAIVHVSQKLPKMTFVETKDLPTQPKDKPHYTSASYVRLGERFADAATALGAP